MNISRSTEIQHVYSVPKTASPPFSAVGLAPLQLHLTYRTQQCNRTCFRPATSRKSWRYSFNC